MRDNELRGAFLKVMYDLRHTSTCIDLDKSLDMGLSENVSHNILTQLSESGLIEWHPVMGGLGVGRLTSFGVDVVEGAVKAPISIIIDHSVTVSGSKNVQIGNSNVQGISIEIDKLNAAIDRSEADFTEKAEAKSLLRKCMENGLLKSILERWLMSKLGG